MSSRPLAQDSDAIVGASKLGGIPDVAAGFVWPRWKERPLSFLAQVDLAVVARYPFCSDLPQDGVLAFFYDPDQETWGFDPRDRGSWLVHFEREKANLRRAALPAPSPVMHPPCALEDSEVETVPPLDSPAVAALGLTTEERNAYWDVLQQMEEQAQGATQHRMLGHASPVQGDMQVECQLVSNGIYCGDAGAHADPRAKALEAGAGAWRLLMQIDSDDNAEMMWGDCGRLYFWLTAEALRRRAFGESWMILQCS
jgi:uncharacterized protein YwqG